MVRDSRVLQELVRSFNLSREGLPPGSRQLQELLDAAVPYVATLLAPAPANSTMGDNASTAAVPNAASVAPAVSMVCTMRLPWDLEALLGVAVETDNWNVAEQLMDTVTNNNIGLGENHGDLAGAASGGASGSHAATGTVAAMELGQRPWRGASDGFCTAEQAEALGRALVKGAIEKHKYKQAERWV